jgi:hypothetical protein
MLVSTRQATQRRRAFVGALSIEDLSYGSVHTAHDGERCMRGWSGQAPTGVLGWASGTAGCSRTIHRWARGASVGIPRPPCHPRAAPRGPIGGRAHQAAFCAPPSTCARSALLAPAPAPAPRARRRAAALASAPPSITQTAVVPRAYLLWPPHCCACSRRDRRRWRGGSTLSPATRGDERPRQSRRGGGRGPVFDLATTVAWLRRRRDDVAPRSAFPPAAPTHGVAPHRKDGRGGTWRHLCWRSRAVTGRGEPSSVPAALSRRPRSGGRRAGSAEEKGSYSFQSTA